MWKNKSQAKREISIEQKYAEKYKELVGADFIETLIKKYIEEKIFFEPIREKLIEKDVSQLYAAIDSFELFTPKDRIETIFGLMSAIDGSIPEEKIRNNLEKIFGKDFISVFNRKIESLKKIKKNVSKKEPISLLEAIVQIAGFSYEPFVAKYPFLKQFLEKSDDPRADWISYMTAAGAGCAVSTKEAYPGEHDELIESIMAVDGLFIFVKRFADFYKNVYKTNYKFAAHSLGIWILYQIGLNHAPKESEEIVNFRLDVWGILNSTIEDYEKKRLSEINK